MKLKTLFQTPTATELAAKELAEAQRIARLKDIVLGAGK
jgi:hypothetical protein